MDILNWVLYLAITCMIVVPFIGFAVSVSCDIYFKHKAKFMGAMAGGLAKAVEEAAQKIKVMKNDPS